MSGNVNVTSANRPKNVLLIAGNRAVSATTGWPIGFGWAELSHPHWAFTGAGYEVDIRSPHTPRSPGRGR